jgi:hypothetical protein
VPSKRTDDEDEDGEDGEDEKPKTRNQSMASAKEINAVFRGRFWTMLKVMWWAVGVNFGGFLSGSSDTNPSKA